MSDTMTDEFRESVRRLKAEVRATGVDIAGAFAKIDSLVEAQIRKIESEVAAGASPVPVCDFADVAAGAVDAEITGRIKQRGAVILRTVSYTHLTLPTKA